MAAFLDEPSAPSESANPRTERAALVTSGRELVFRQRLPPAPFQCRRFEPQPARLAREASVTIAG